MDDKKTNEMVQELKAERVQEEIMVVSTDEPVVVSLKAERVQEPEAASVPAGAKMSSFFELVVSPHQRTTIDLQALQVCITLEGPVAGTFMGAGLGEAG